MEAILTRMQAAGILDAGACRDVQGALDEGVPVEDALIGAGRLAEDDLLAYLAADFGLPYVDVDGIQVDPALMRQFPARLLLAHGLLPLHTEGDAVVVAASRLFQPAGID